MRLAMKLLLQNFFCHRISSWNLKFQINVLSRSNQSTNRESNFTFLTRAETVCIVKYFFIYFVIRRFRHSITRCLFKSSIELTNDLAQLFERKWKKGEEWKKKAGEDGERVKSKQIITLWLTEQQKQATKNLSKSEKNAGRVKIDLQTHEVRLNSFSISFPCSTLQLELNLLEERLWLSLSYKRRNMIYNLALTRSPVVS